MRLPRSTRLPSLVAAVALLAGAGVAADPVVQPAAAAPAVLDGVDIGYPQCVKPTTPVRSGTGKPLHPDSSVGFTITQANAGLAYYRNNCLGDHFAWGRARGPWLGTYVFPNYPDAAMLKAATNGRYGACTTTTCRLRTSGYDQTKWAMARVAETGVRVPMVWVDVEHQPNLGGTREWRTGTTGREQNREVLRGVFDYLTENGYRIGLYSYAYGWNQIVGDWSLPYPQWVPSGLDTKAARLAKCDPAAGFSDGPIWVVQSVVRPGNNTDWDYNSVCSRGMPALKLMFASSRTDKPLVPRPRKPELTPHAATTLRYMDRGPAVVALQKALGMKVTGLYGSHVRREVAALKAKHRLGGNDRSIGFAFWVKLGA